MSMRDRSLSARFKYILRWFGLILLVPIALIVLLLLINVFDQDIKPEAQAFSDFTNQHPPAKQNAYYPLIGHAAPIGEDPHQKGIDIVNAHNQRASEIKGYDPSIHDIRDQVLGPKKLSFQGETKGLCEQNSVRCLPSYRQKKDAIKEMLHANRILVERYYRLYQYPRFTETAKESAYILFPVHDGPTNSLVRAAIGLQADSGRTQEALAALLRDTKFWRLAMRDGRTLIGKMIAIARIKHNMRLLSEIIATRSLTDSDAALARQILVPLTPQELDFREVFRSEFAYSRNVIENMPEWGEPGGTWSENTLWVFLTRPLLKPRATINLMYERSLDLADLAQLPPEKLVKQLTMEHSTRDSGFQWISWHSAYNPLGKWLVDLTRLPYVEYLGRAHNLDALMRLVTLQLEIKIRNLRDLRLQGYLAQAEPGLKNPYTGEPARWDDQNQSLYFICMHENMTGELLSKRIEVYTSAK